MRDNNASERPGEQVIVHGSTVDHEQTARVAAGELPPVDERIPVDPVVQEMLADGVGRYGGTLKVSEAVGFMTSAAAS